MTNYIQMQEGSSAPQLSQARLERVEKAFGVVLPHDYVDFLRAHNGGVPVQKYFPHQKNQIVVERFLSLVENYADERHGPYDVEVVWSQIESRLNDYLIPIAALFAGDFLCLDFQGTSEPSVVIWNHDLSRDDVPSTEIVAQTFSSFLGMLHS